VVTPEDGMWHAYLPELAGANTRARTLPALDKAVREVVAPAADVGAFTAGWSAHF
jgi:predicted RNase H-like HicB family nuclease